MAGGYKLTGTAYCYNVLDGRVPPQTFARHIVTIATLQLLFPEGTSYSECTNGGVGNDFVIKLD